MKRFIVNFLLIITFFVLQGTLFEALSFGKISPNICLMLIVSLGLMRGTKTGLISGFFTGLLFDIFAGSYLGFYALLYMYLGYMAGLFNKIFFPEDIKLPMTIIGISDLVYGFLSYVFLFLLKGNLNLSYCFVHICIPECIYTLVVTIVFYPLVLSIDKAFERAERKQESKVAKQMERYFN
jgi:rod shape-determining protein MreD